MAACDNTGVKKGLLSLNSGTFPVDPCTNYWQNANLWIDHGGSTKVDQATAGFDPANPTGPQAFKNQIMARVFNNSSNIINNINVEAWVCNYTLGVSPFSALASSNPANQPMTGFVQSIGPNSSVSIACTPSWITTAADVALNGGHVCLAVNCFGDAPDDGQSVVGHTIPNGPTGSSFNFCCDAHHAQRNVAVRAIPVTMLREGEFDFQFFAANPDVEREREVILAIKPVKGVAAFGRNEQQLLLSGPHAKVLFDEKRQCRLVLANDPAETPLHESPLGFPELFLEGDAIGRGRELKAVLPPKGRIPLALRGRFDPKEELGGFHTFDVTQTDSYGNVLGGIRMMTLFTNDEKPQPIG